MLSRLRDLCTQEHLVFGIQATSSLPAAERDLDVVLLGKDPRRHEQGSSTGFTAQAFKIFKLQSLLEFSFEDHSRSRIYLLNVPAKEDLYVS